MSKEENIKLELPTSAKQGRKCKSEKPVTRIDELDTIAIYTAKTVTRWKTKRHLKFEAGHYYCVDWETVATAKDGISQGCYEFDFKYSGKVLTRSERSPAVINNIPGHFSDIATNMPKIGSKSFPYFVLVKLRQLTKTIYNLIRNFVLMAHPKLVLCSLVEVVSGKLPKNAVFTKIHSHTIHSYPFSF